MESSYDEVAVINSEELENLPNTQPFDLNSESADSYTADQRIWAYLVPIVDFLPPVALKKSKFCCGRQPLIEDNETQFLMIEPNEQTPENFPLVVSRRHFVIEKDSDGDVFISDLSSNGTFVNSVRVGQGRKRPLVHNDKISFLVPANSGFKFMTNESNDNTTKLPPIVRKKYIVGKMLGSGVSGCVYTAFAIEANYQKVALKVIEKAPTLESLSNEVDILCKLKHPNIIRLHEVIEDAKYFVIVMELARGGELFNYIFEDFNKKTLDEDVAKLQFYQILVGVAYMHSKNVCHRDLKLENILLAERSRTSLIKIADFGLSKAIGFGTRMTSFVGTSNYIAPEVLKNGSNGPTSYGLKVDMWSLGCILYSLLCGSPAFHQSNINEDLNTKILCGNFNKSHPGLENVSGEAKDLIQKLLQVDPRLRLTARATLSHPWLDDPAMIQRARAVGSAAPLEVKQISYGVRNLKIQSPIRLTAGARLKRRSHVIEEEEDDDDKVGSVAPPTKRNLR